MKAGDTFILPDDSADKHLWVVISDPDQDPERILVVGLTSYDVTKEDVCLIKAREHP